MIISDCHLHSSYSGDSDTPMEEMIKAAIGKGLKEVCFTEHQDFDFIYEDNEPKDYFEVNTDQYLYDLAVLKEYAGKICVSFGIELGLQEHLAQKLAIYSRSHEFDFIIASQHLCNRKDPYLKSFFEGRDEKEAYHEYFAYEAMNFDSFGHLDYVLRYGPTRNTNFSMKEYGDDIDVILKRLIAGEKSLEVNTSGFSYNMNATHPCRDILKRYKELGGELITIGSDAHNVDKVGSHFSEAEEMLLDLGFEYYAIYKQRMPEMMPLKK